LCGLPLFFFHALIFLGMRFLLKFKKEAKKQ
jgi:hypothetical protein